MTGPDLPGWTPLPDRLGALQSALADGGGLVQVQAFAPEEIPGLMKAAGAGNAAALLILAAGDVLAEGIKADQAIPTTCQVCPAPLNAGPYWLVVVTGLRPDPSTICSAGICSACIGDGAQAQEIAFAAVGRLFPQGLRRIGPIHPEGGRA